MSLTEDLPWTCPCGTANVARARVSWPLGASPEDGAALATLLTNTFHVFPCVRCGYPAVVDRDLLVIHHAEHWAVQVAHDANDRASIAPKLAQGFPGYRTRVVADSLALNGRSRFSNRRRGRFGLGTQNQEVGPHRALREPVAAEDRVLR